MTTRIITGDCREALRALPDESVNCVVTSPPYWGLRDYGNGDGGIGLEPSIGEHMAALVEVFREVRRVLRKDGTCWVNYGDAYCSTAPGTMGDPLRQEGIFAGVKDKTAAARAKYRPKTPSGLKPKDLIGLPWRLAFALQDDGWWLRSDIIWAKPNPMPESVTDRPTRAHEYIFLLTKSARYWYDADAVAEPISQASLTRWGGPVARRPSGSAPERNDFRGDFRGGSTCGLADDGMRNLRTVWSITTTPFAEAHFATFPPELAERCIKAGCPVGGTVLDPFGGAGTVGLVADRLQRDAILIEMNPDYAEMARRRIEGDAPMFAEVTLCE